MLLHTNPPPDPHEVAHGLILVVRVTEVMAPN